MKTTRRLILLAIMVVTTAQVRAQDPNFWIFLCFGQSNMAGSSPAEAQDSIVPDGFLSLSAVNGTDGRKIGEWRKAVPPLCRQHTKLSPVDYFGRTVLEHAPKGTRVGVVHVAVEGCPITFFDKDACAEVISKEDRDWMNNILDQYDRNPYQRLVDMARIAQRDGVIKGILLHQGETDAYDRKWQRTVHKIYKDLQHDLELDSFSVPLLVGEVVRKEYNGTCAHANPTIDDIIQHYHNMYLVTSEGCPPAADGTHFSTEGYRELGRRYAMRYLERAIPEATKGKKESTTVVKSSTVEVKTVDVAANIDEKNLLKATASEPLTQVDIVSFSGQTIKTITVNNSRDVEIDLNQLPDETLVFVFKAANGATNTIKLD